MKKSFGAVTVLVLSVSANAAQVSFTPTGPTSVFAGTPVSFQLEITGTSAAIGQFNAIVGTREGAGLAFLPLGSFSINIEDAIENLPGVSVQQPIDSGYFMAANPMWSDLGFGAFHPSVSFARDVHGNLPIGLLTVNTTGLAEGDYLLVIDTALEDLVGGAGAQSVINGGVETLDGMAVVTIVPEPATMLLLGIGGLVMARRRLA